MLKVAVTCSLFRKCTLRSNIKDSVISMPASERPDPFIGILPLLLDSGDRLLCGRGFSIVPYGPDGANRVVCAIDVE